MFAIALAKGGANVAIVARRAAELDETAQLVRVEGARCETIVGDVTEPGLAVRAIRQAEESLGPVEALVANAAVLSLGSVADIDPVTWRRTIEINLVAPMIWTQAALAVMRPRQRGRIVNVTSVGSLIAQPFVSAYCAAKAGLNQLTGCLAGEIAGEGIAVFALSPGAHTAMGRELYENDVMPEAQKAQYRQLMEGRADTIAAHSIELFCFLMSGDADKLSGQYLGFHPAQPFDTVDRLRARLSAKTGSIVAK
jgi:NAD(P)-dependent dehydrogenase (short-subunit alcohol dehydrogenase family)